jgi:acyl-CoA thioesterase I
MPTPARRRSVSPFRLLLAVLLALPVLASCRRPADEPEGRRAMSEVVVAKTRAPRRAPAPAPAPAAPTRSEGPLVVFLGDSLTAGLGLAEEQAFPALVAQQLREAGTPIRMVNAGVSGDTSAGGLRRLPWLLRQRPDVLVVGLGANDGLRGLPLAEVEANLREIVRLSGEAGARVLLLGMRIPPNYGGDYAGGFAAVYERVAEDLDVPLVPFLLEGVGGDPDLNLPDGLHPNPEGQERVAGNVLPYLREVLAADRATASRAAAE